MMEGRNTKPLRIGLIFLMGHTLLLPVLMALRMEGSDSFGRFFEKVVHFLDYPIAKSLQSHEVQSRTIGPVAEWLEAHFPTPLLAETIVFVILGGVFYFIVGVLGGIIIVLRRTKQRSEKS